MSFKRETTKQLREFCQKLINELNHPQIRLDDNQTLKNLITLSGELHKRLALLEGVSPGELDGTTF